MEMSLSKHWEMVKDREALCTAVHGVQSVGHNLVTEQQQQQFSIRTAASIWISALSVWLDLSELQTLNL